MSFLSPHSRLILHLDVNGTIIPTDMAQDRGAVEMLNVHLSKQAYLSPDGSSWWNGSPLTAPAPLLPAYKYLRHCSKEYGCREVPSISSPNGPPSTFSGYPDSDAVADYRKLVLGGKGGRKFTDEVGRNYKGDLVAMVEKLKIDKSVDPELPTAELEFQGAKHEIHILLPSFLTLLTELRGKDVTYVVRTFGHDIPMLRDCFSRLAALEKYGVKAPGPEHIGTLLRMGPNKPCQLILMDGSTLYGDPDVQAYFEGHPPGTVLLVQDDYELWSKHGSRPSSGKPLLFDLPEGDSESRSAPVHIFFDDNIHIDADDSIACVRVRLDPKSSPSQYDMPYRLEELKVFLGTVLIQANLYLAIFDSRYFIDELGRAYGRYETLRERYLAVRASAFSSVDVELDEPIEANNNDSPNSSDI